MKASQVNKGAQVHFPVKKSKDSCPEGVGRQSMVSGGMQFVAPA